MENTFTLTGSMSTLTSNTGSQSKHSKESNRNNGMVKALTIAIFAALATTVFTPVQAKENKFTSKLFYGDKSIDAAAWSTQAKHGSLGLLNDVGFGLSSMRLAVDLFASGSEQKNSSQVQGTYTAEMHLGVRHYFNSASKLSPYIGGGINLAYASQQNQQAGKHTEQEAMDSGMWLNTGLDYLITEHFTAGVDLRYASAEVDLYGETVALNAFTTGAALGFRW